MIQTLQFLRKVKANNNREWFNENKKDYDASLLEMKSFLFDVKAKLEQHDQIEGSGKLYRIYRDVRFSKDKTPYKSSWSGSFKRATKALRGGYYFHIAPGSSYIAGGFFAPNGSDLLHIRKHISSDPSAIRKIIGSKPFKSYFHELTGEKVKTAPKGFSKEDPAIELLRFKQFIVKHPFKDAEVKNPNFTQHMADGFNNMRPFFDYMSEILGTDMNGEILTE